jgi:hypothetical protein
MKVLRKITCNSSEDKVRGSIIREECEIESQNKWINNRGAKWNENIVWRVTDE